MIRVLAAALDLDCRVAMLFLKNHKRGYDVEAYF